MVNLDMKDQEHAESPNTEGESSWWNIMEKLVGKRKSKQEL